jgi:uncharacterized protein YodC (DUF2158 family)
MSVSTPEKKSFEPGAVVSLRSGGPLMTVHSTSCVSGSEQIACIWFTNGGDLRTESFLACVLKAGA